MAWNRVSETLFGQGRHISDVQLFRKTEIALIAAAIIAFHGVFWLGPAMDDYLNIERYQQVPLTTLLTWKEYNRAPVYLLGIYPLLLLMPNWLMHIPIIIAHTGSAILLARLLQWLRLGPLVANISAALFLFWPANYEVLLWVAASGGAFGVFLTLLAMHSLIRDQFVRAGLLVILGMFCVESVVLPALFLTTIVLLNKGVSWKRGIVFLCGVSCIYGIYQVFRLIWVNGDTSSLTPYKTSFSIARLVDQLSTITKIALGFASSRDISWIWSHTVSSLDVSILLPVAFLAAAALLVFLGVLFYGRSISLEPLAIRFQVKAMAVSLCGFAISISIFLVLSNAMQARYTYTGVAYLSVFFGVLMGFLIAEKKIIVRCLGLILIMMLNTWALYHSWSDSWLNWRVAHQVSQRIINEVGITYQETAVRQIFLVNEPKAVGNAFALSRDWAYKSAGHLYVDPELTVEADVLYQYASGQAGKIGTKFADTPCVFMSWKDGHRVVATKILHEDGMSILNCNTGYIEEIGPEEPIEELIRFKATGSKEHFAEFQP